jgi:hypothetical protein
VKRISIRLLVSLIAGLVSFYFGAVALQLLPSQWLLDHYSDPFGLATLVGRIFCSYYSVGENDTGMFEDSARAELAARLFTASFWAVLFGAVYFYFVFRTKRSNQPLQPTADRRE